MTYANKLLGITVLMVSLAVGFTGCESPTEESGTGTLSVLLTDAPFPVELVAEANVTIDSLSIREKGGGEGDPFLTLSTAQQTFNLLDLRNGVTEVLAELDIPIGIYNLVRLHISEANVVLHSGDTASLDIPSADKSGLKLFIRPDLHIGNNALSEILLDIDVSKSFVLKGQGQTDFTFKPVVRVVNLSAAGSIKGKVTDANGDQVIGAQVSAVLDTVISYTFTDSSGSYWLIGLPEDTYTLRVEAEGQATLEEPDIAVTAGNVTNQNLQFN